MKIGILGAGVVGSNLGVAFAKRGHQVMYSSRTPDSEKMQALLDETQDGQAGTVAETVAFGDVIFVAIDWRNGLAEVLQSIDDWSGKVVVDTTNRFGDEYANSAAIDVKNMTGAPTVKAFNTIAAEHMGDPKFWDVAASMFICGDEEAKEVVVPLIIGIGFDVVDCGDIDYAWKLEFMASIWLDLAFQQDMGRDIAFKLLRK